MDFLGPTRKKKKLKSATERNKRHRSNEQSKHRSPKHNFHFSSQNKQRKDMKLHLQKAKQTFGKPVKENANRIGAVTRNRLTRRLGIYCQGQTSKPTCRLPKEFYSDEMKARAEEDLNKILDLAKPDIAKISYNETLYPKLDRGPSFPVDDAIIVGNQDFPTVSRSASSGVNFDSEHHLEASPRSISNFSNYSLPPKHEHLDINLSNSVAVKNSIPMSLVDKQLVGIPLKKSKRSNSQEGINTSQSFIDRVIKNLYEHMDSTYKKLYAEVDDDSEGLFRPLYEKRLKSISIQPKPHESLNNQPALADKSVACSESELNAELNQCNRVHSDAEHPTARQKHCEKISSNVVNDPQAPECRNFYLNIKCDSDNDLDSPIKLPFIQTSQEKVCYHSLPQVLPRDEVQNDLVFVRKFENTLEGYLSSSDEGTCADSYDTPVPSTSWNQKEKYSRLQTPKRLHLTDSSDEYSPANSTPFLVRNDCLIHPFSRRLSESPGFKYERYKRY